MKEVNPQLTPAQARRILQETRTIDGNLKVGGLVNTHRAVAAAMDASRDLQSWSEQWLFRQRLAAILANRY
ncbi:MAG: hypothetical protein HC902_07455 [Calothrix sp. SM1_5_4]|nr:hypothetical protein [Calothrix sp. SM1_5_4]